MKSNLALRNSTATQIVEARDLPDRDTEYLLDDISIDQLLRVMTGQTSSKIASGALLLADEWD